MTEDFFRDTSDITKGKIWKERIEPYINESFYKVSIFHSDVIRGQKEIDL